MKSLVQSSEGFSMMAAVSGMAVSVGESSFGQWCSKVSAVIDCAIPIALTVALAIGSGAILFGFVQ
jgi:hypothetical protein